MKIELREQLQAPKKYIHRIRREEFPVEPYRNEFQRDRDRILYSKSFRRLSGKTQVFLPTMDDHVRTRLTHTIEVMQISKNVGENLGLDLDLIEAISLGHDIGHAPFGHVGERTLNLIMNKCDILGKFQNSLLPAHMGYKHNFQGLRVTNNLASIYGEEGLNLSNFTNWGILNHTSLLYKKCTSYHDNCYLKRESRVCEQNGEYSLNFYDDTVPITHLLDSTQEAWSFEGFTIKQCDEIAQRHHDIEDGIIARIISKSEIMDSLNSLLNEYFKIDYQKKNTIYKQILASINSDDSEEPNLLNSYLSKFIIGLYCSALIDNSANNLSIFINEKKLKTKIDFQSIYSTIKKEDVVELISLPPKFKEIDNQIHDFLRDRILNSHKAQEMDGKGRFIIRSIFKAYLTNPRQMYDNTILSTFRIYKPDLYRFKTTEDLKLMGQLRNEIDSAEKKSDIEFQAALLRAICDNISGMTDNFATQQYHKLYG